MIGKGTDCLYPLYVPVEKGKRERIRVRCMSCDNCKSFRAQEWCMRLEMESLYWKDSCFVTLTYNDESLPLNIVDPYLFYSDEEIKEHSELDYLYIPTHNPRHLQLFLKRLRKQLKESCRYYAVGEYGTRFGRSHLHIMFFGVAFTSENVRIIERCWPYGFVKVTPFFKETCSYIAGYVQKKLYGKEKYMFRLPEFMRCSHHLGERWLMDHLDQFDDEHAYISFHGYKKPIPRQFRKILLKLGILTKVSPAQMLEMQLEEYRELKKDCDDKGISLSTFFENRIKIARERKKRILSSRVRTGDI